MVVVWAFASGGTGLGLAIVKTPVSILFLAVSAAFAYCAAYAVYVSRKKPKKTVLVFCVSVCVLMLAVLRILGVRLEAYDVTFLPLGVSVYLLATVSMLIDALNHSAVIVATTAPAKKDTVLLRHVILPPTGICCLRAALSSA